MLACVDEPVEAAPIPEDSWDTRRDPTEPDLDTGDPATTGTDSVSAPLTLQDLRSGDLLITEIHADPGAVPDDLGEWFEVYNNTDWGLNLDGLKVSDDRGEGFVLGRTVLAPRGYLVMGSSPDVAINGGVRVDVAYDIQDFGLDDRGDNLVLANSHGIIDEVDYALEAAYPITEGASMSLNPDGAWNNDQPGNWCPSLTSFGAGDLGTPGLPNDACGITDRPKNNGPLGLTQLQAGDLVITEIMRNPDAVDDEFGEWFEIHNPLDEDVSLLGLMVTDQGEDAFIVSDNFILAAKSFAVFGANTDASLNGGVFVDVPYSLRDFQLDNEEDEIIISTGEIEIDAVTADWEFALREGSSITLDANMTASDNDQARNWCLPETAYGDGDAGTPGLPNAPCDKP